MPSIFSETLQKLVKMSFRGSKAKSHNSVIVHSQFAWICIKALFYILWKLSASKLLRKAWKFAKKACNHERIISSDLKPEVNALLNISCPKVMISYCITKSYQFEIFDWLVLKLQDTETETLKRHYIYVYKVFG